MTTRLKPSLNEFCIVLSVRLHKHLPKLPAISAWSKLISPNPLPPTAGLRIPSTHISAVINPSGRKPPGLLDPRIHSRIVGFCQLHQKSGQAFRLRQCDVRDRFGFNELLNPSPFSFRDATGRAWIMSQSDNGWTCLYKLKETYENLRKVSTDAHMNDTPICRLLEYSDETMANPPHYPGNCRCHQSKNHADA
ncbi:hypothetical protein CDAR_611211 [Caerostris darwini]|uniref:Uncharacterized protein n=1 Tax=Caerostris darwini TaxID=1538125 RepID=A0AAV4TFE0_9ARAC|nr:hypothetical protein CDAR_611211 [Caerostris darwini]